MIPLPKYVHAPKNRAGRHYYFFQKYRATDREWPRVPLPPEPMSPEFALRSAMLDRLEATQSDGQWRWFYRDVLDRLHDLPQPADAEAFWKAADKADDIGKKLAAGIRKSVSSLVLEFKESAAFKVRPEGAQKTRGGGIAQSTHDQYGPHLETIDRIWGDLQVTTITPVDVQMAIDTFSETPSAGRVFRSVLSRLISWGIPRGYSLTNPVEHTERPAEGGTYDPWPPWAFELFMEFARADLFMPVYSALFTGQRVSDVVKMRRPIGAASEMPIVAQKTGELVPVQIHSEYRLIIRAEKSEHEMLHLRADGEPWTYEGLKTAWQRQMDFPATLYSSARDRAAAKAMLRFRENRLVFHGLRKNAVNMLLEVGCSEERVASIVGMTPAMVHHYSKKVSQFRLARDAMKQLEAGWSALRPAILGNVTRLQG